MDAGDFYKNIFKRKSFHIFKDTEKISNHELENLKEFINNNIKYLDKDIKVKIEIVPEEDTTCKRGAEYCILFYSENKNDYLRNIGYIGEQIDLYLCSQNIGALWFGIGKPKYNYNYDDNLEYVIMISIAKIPEGPENRFRKDMFKSKRKDLSEIWSGETLNVAEIVRFAPSACNSQPWYTENTGTELLIYRYKKPGKRGIMPINKVTYYNKIDTGIYLFFLETCLDYNKYDYERFLYHDNIEDNNTEKILIAKYTYRKRA